MNFRDAFGKYLLDLNMFYLAYYKKHRLKIFFINFFNLLSISLNSSSVSPVPIFEVVKTLSLSLTPTSTLSASEIFFINLLRKLKITKFIPKNLKKLSRCPKCGKETYYYEPLTILTDMTICTGCKVRFVVEN